jgi:hypothetical protein
LVELPAVGESVQIVAGYTAGNLAGFASTAGAQSLLLDAYAAGGQIDFVNELDRTAIRITAPRWAMSMLTDHVADLFKDVPTIEERSTQSAADFRAKVEEEIRSALLGSPVPTSGYMTDQAFVLTSAPIPNNLRDRLAAIPRRGSENKTDAQVDRLPGERTLRFKSDLPEGAVVFASPLPGVYYKQWYLVLLLDRLIHRVVRLPLKTSLPLTVRPHYYRIELTVPSGQFPEPAEENLLQEIQRLQFTTGDAREFTAARQDALSYLSGKAVREWFASRDIVERLEEGMQWLQSMTSDDMRIAARDLLIMNRVIASWGPKAKQTSVAVESLPSANNHASASNSASSSFTPVTRLAGTLGETRVVAFPSHQDPTPTTSLPERLVSGVSIAASSIHAVFVSGASLTRFDREPTVEDQKQFQKYRADRILVLAPSPALDRARQVWNSFKGSATGETGVPRGKVSSGDLSALFVLKTLLDLKLIEAGWWPNAEIRLDANQGSTLDIRADEERRTQILDWIKSIASGVTSETYFSWAREVAIHHFGQIVPDIQALIWERDVQGTIQPLETVFQTHVQDVARIYF